MKILSLECTNIKRIRAVHIEPTGNMVVIGGRNASGKTSTLNSIWWALQGARNIQRNPIRDGEDEAIIKLDLGEIKITRTFTRDRDGEEFTTKLVVMSDKGAKYPRPDQMLKDLWSELCVDPLEFLRMKPADQFDTLKPFASGIDFEAFQGAHDADMDERKEVNRKVDQTWAQAKGIVVPDGTPDEPIDESALVDQIATAGQHNGAIETERYRRETADRELARFETSRKELLEQIEDLIEQRDMMADRIVKATEEREARAALPDTIDTTAVRAHIDAARTTNANVARLKQKRELERQADALEKESAALTADIKKREKDKQDAIAKAKLPVPGLGFGDGFVTMNGQPFEQASDAEQLRASIGIAMAGKQELKVILVRDGSLLDSTGMQLLAEMATEKDWQVWLEKVSDGAGEGIGFVIEDGMVVGAEVPAAEETAGKRKKG